MFRLQVKHYRRGSMVVGYPNVGPVRYVEPKKTRLL